MKNLTKKQLIELLTQSRHELSMFKENQRNERKAMFNKYEFLRELEEEIMAEIENEQINDEEEIREYINSSIDNICIYYRTCFEIVMELNATDFTGWDMGEPNNICQLAYFALDEFVNNELNFNELEEKINARDAISEDMS